MGLLIKKCVDGEYTASPPRFPQKISTVARPHQVNARCRSISRSKLFV